MIVAATCVRDRRRIVRIADTNPVIVERDVRMNVNGRHVAFNTAFRGRDFAGLLCLALRRMAVEAVTNVIGSVVRNRLVRVVTRRTTQRVVGLLKAAALQQSDRLESGKLCIFLRRRRGEHLRQAMATTAHTDLLERSVMAGAKADREV